MADDDGNQGNNDDNQDNNENQQNEDNQGNNDDNQGNNENQQNDDNQDNNDDDQDNNDDDQGNNENQQNDDDQGNNENQQNDDDQGNNGDDQDNNKDDNNDDDQGNNNGNGQNDGYNANQQYDDKNDDGNQQNDDNINNDAADDGYHQQAESYDDYYYDDFLAKQFRGYQVSTIENAKSVVLIGTSSYCLICWLFLPFLMIIGKRHAKRIHQVSRELLPIDENETKTEEKEQNDRYVEMTDFEGKKSKPMQKIDDLLDTYVELSEGGDNKSVGESITSKEMTDEEVVKPLRKIFSLRGIKHLIKIDHEARKILRMAIPFTISGFMYAFFSVLTISLISYRYSPDEMIAYTMVGFVTGLTSFVANGVYTSIETLNTHAFGAENYKLAGQYMQISIIFNLVYYIIAIWVWIKTMYSALMWFGFDENVANHGLAYIKISAAAYLLSGVSGTFVSLIDVSDHAKFNSIVDVIHGSVVVFLIGFAPTILDQPSLSAVAWLELLTDVIFLSYKFFHTKRKRWLKPVFKGALDGFALTNQNGKLAWRVIKYAVPLSLGDLIAELEWHILTIMASFIGSSEVASFAIYGSLWGAITYTTSGVDSAAAIRVAYHLGQGDAKKAKTSVYKSLFLVVAIAFVVSVLLFIWNDELAQFMTGDEDMRENLANMIPILVVCFFTMTPGILAWSILGAQGRYRLGMLVDLCKDLFFTFPMAFLFEFILHLGIEGIVAASALGYVTTGMFLLGIILCSDWEKYARRIKEDNSIAEEPCADDDTLSLNTVESDDKFFQDFEGLDEPETNDQEMEYIPFVLNPKGLILKNSLSFRIVRQPKDLNQENRMNDDVDDEYCEDDEDSLDVFDKERKDYLKSPAKGAISQHSLV